MKAKNMSKLMEYLDTLTPLEKMEVDRAKSAYMGAVCGETQAYVEAKEAYDEAKEHLDINDPDEREVLTTLLQSMMDAQSNVLVIAKELETHFNIVA